MANTSRQKTPAPDIFNRGSGMTEGDKCRHARRPLLYTPPASFGIPKRFCHNDRAVEPTLEKTDTAVTLSEEQLAVVRALYPWFKEEVFRRREQMMRLTAFGSAFLLLLLVTILALAPPWPMAPTVKVFAVTGTALFAALFVYLILQQRDRHRVAKRTLIELEQVLGLYEGGLYRVGRALYPTDWQTAWLHDRSTTVYVALIATLAILVIAAVVSKG